MNLIIDAGNTCIKLVAFDGDSPVEVCTADYDELEKFTRFLSAYPFNRGIVSTVVDLPIVMERAIDALPFEVTLKDLFSRTTFELLESLSSMPLPTHLGLTGWLPQWEHT